MFPSRRAVTSSAGKRLKGMVVIVGACGVAVAAATPGAAGRSLPAQARADGLSVLPAAGLPVFPATSRRGRIYAGSTSAGAPIVFELSRDGRRLARFGGQWGADCKSGGMMFFSTGDASVGLPLRRDGSFTVAGEDQNKNETGFNTTTRQQMRGKVKGAKLSGSWSASVTDTDAAGATVDTCTADFSFHARSAKGRSFGGFTSQGTPVSLQLTKVKLSRTTLVEVTALVGWIGKCTEADGSDGGGGIYSYETVALPIERGRFGGHLNLSQPQNDGSETHWDMTMPGKQRRQREGTFKLRMSWTNPDGSNGGYCETPHAIRWQARSG